MKKHDSTLTLLASLIPMAILGYMLYFGIKSNGLLSIVFAIWTGLFVILHTLVRMKKIHENPNDEKMYLKLFGLMMYVFIIHGATCCMSLLAILIKN